MLQSARSLFVGSSLLTTAFVCVPAHATLISASGPTAADIQAAFDDFQAGVSFPNGGQRIRWDGVSEDGSSPNTLPADLFRNRGALFETPGTGLQVSAGFFSGNPSQFGNLDSHYPFIFEAFSQERLFTAIGSNIVDVVFVIPLTNMPGLTTGFASVFSDVDLPNTTSIQYYGASGQLLAEDFALPGGSNSESFSFLGRTFGSAVVSRVRITNGNFEVSAGFSDGNGKDQVVMDDFLFGTPVAAALPEPPSTWLTLAAGLLSLFWLRRARSTRASERTATMR